MTFVIVNYKTLELIRECYCTLRTFYRKVPVILVDNGSYDESTSYIQDINDENLTKVMNQSNIGHGRALHRATTMANTDYVFTLDSDCVILRGDFITEMGHFFSDPLMYAVGRKWEAPGWTLPYIHPAAMLFDRNKYLKLHPFTHLGAPCWHNMDDAQKKGYHIQDFDFSPYIHHKWMGTRAKYGWDGTGRQ